MFMCLLRHDARTHQNTKQFRQNEDLTYTCSNSKVRVPSGPQEAKEKTDINVDASELVRNPKKYIYQCLLIG